MISPVPASGVKPDFDSSCGAAVRATSSQAYAPPVTSQARLCRRLLVLKYSASTKEASEGGGSWEQTPKRGAPSR